MIREARLTMALLMLLAAFIANFTGVALSDQSESSDIVHLGSGPRPIYRIGYSGEGSLEIEDLIDQAQMSSAKGSDDLASSDQASEASTSELSPSMEAPQFDSPSEDEEAALPRDASNGGVGSDRSQTAAEEIEEETPSYVRVPVVSDPAGAEVYIDGIFSGITPFIATVEPEAHLVEAYLDGHWNWFNVIDFRPDMGTVPITLTTKNSPLSATNGSNSGEASALRESRPAVESNGSSVLQPPPYMEDDFVEHNYRKLLIVVALLSFLIGSGSVAAWARSRLLTSVEISFPRDGEDRWAGLVEGRSTRIRSPKKQLYILIRSDDDHLQVKTKVEPNREGRWSTRCDVEEGTVYRIYAVVVDRPLIEGAHLEEIPSHRAISEVGPVAGKGKAAKPSHG